MLKKLGRSFRAMMADDSGQTMLEYIVIVAIVVIAGIAAFAIIKRLIARKATQVSREVTEGTP